MGFEGNGLFVWRASRTNSGVALAGGNQGAVILQTGVLNRQDT